MSPPARKTLRIFVGFIGGFLGGSLLGVGLILLLFAVCTAAGGGWASETKPVWVGAVIFFAQPAIAVLFPLVGSIVGVIWAVRRNRRDATNA